jgi:hypothetical protein
MREASFDLDSHTIRVLDGSYLQNGEPTVAAREFAATLIGLFDRMRVFAAKRCLALYNDNWRRQGDPVLDERQFCSRLTNPGIVLYDEIGGAAVYFDDSNMFAGHWVEVLIFDGEISDASMIG